ncbi:MAG: RagB/SusD family nutrient uptake outer membrane protein [Cyclobacteriaceae bacterium]|nr:RagB/SusD family nutrient uptake outer membrane protein [Cyclobacteriaceae bacterium]
MKTKYLIGLFFASVLASCSDFFEAPSKSSLDESVIFSTPGLARGAVDGILIPMMETNSYRGRYLPMYGMNTDAEWHNSSQNQNGTTDLATYNAQPNNDQMNLANAAWAMMYSGIERANLCIRGLRTHGSPATNPEMGELLAAALTYRAIYYADLIKAWGDVPARFEPITSETLYQPKADRDVIYNQLIKDLEEAATLAPWPNGSALTSSVEKVNKAFVKGLRARLALVAAGYSQRPDGIRKGQLADFTEQQLYQIALQECKDVIESGRAHLEPSFETLWRKYNQENSAAGGESLWEIPFSPIRGRMLFTFAVRHDAADQWHNNGANRGGVAGPLPNLFYDYDAKDTRRDVTCVPYKYGAASGTTTSPINGATRPFARQELVGLNTWYFGKFRYEWMTRFVDNSNDDGVNKIYMRYAEILLMAVEAANELGDIGTAKNYLKEIRRRAFAAADHATKVDTYVDALGGKEAVFNAIVDEHKFEFTGEMERKQALIRWNLLGTKLDEAKVKMNNLRNQSGEYADVPANVYYRYAADDETLEIYGLNRGETTNPGAGWTETAQVWVRPGAIADAKIDNIYRRNPDNYQFWPIFQVFIDGSNGTLVNDYGY